MVTRGTYYDEDEQLAHRYSNRGHGYPLNHDRDQTFPTPHHDAYTRQNCSSHNLYNKQSPEQEANSAPRRRIPVACGRCRKRKIRCSGDPGNGQPCFNCKTAGHEICQFLRVSSTEAQMKNDGNDFGYDSATSALLRFQCRTSPFGPQSQSYNPHGSPLNSDTSLSHRHSSFSAYQPFKYYGTSSYGEFTDENVEYGMPTSNYPIINQGSTTIPYASVGSARGWAHAQLPKSNALFVEQDSSYGHCPLPSYSTPLTYRPSVNSELKSSSLHSMSNALSPAVIGTDRVLPAPATGPCRVAQGTSSYHRATDNSLPMSQATMYSDSSPMGISMVNAVKALSGGSASDSMASSTYIPLSSSHIESVPSSQISYGSHCLPYVQHNDGSYTESHDGHHSLYQSSNNTSGETSNYSISQTSSSISSHRPSISSQSGDDGRSQANNASGSLVNGYQYTPPAADHGSYPTPLLQPRSTDQAAKIFPQQSANTA